MYFYLKSIPSPFETVLQVSFIKTSRTSSFLSHTTLDYWKKIVVGKTLILNKGEKRKEQKNYLKK